MTPEEKAIELVDTFEQHASPVNEYGSIEQPTRTKNAIQCAIIDVDGKISLLESLFDKGLDNIHITLESPVRAYRDIINPEIKYWQEVMNHLNQM